jgi:hypothetical protein
MENPELSDYFAAEVPIVEQLKSAVTLVSGKVWTFSDSDKIEESQKNESAALHVIHGGDRLGRSAADGKSQTFDQVWIVIVAVREPKDQTSGTFLRDIAGPIICQVLRALQGFKPSDYHGELHRMETIEPVYKSGFAFFPLAFSTKMTI